MTPDSIGGGGFALVHAPNGSFSSIDFRETAPAAADPYMFEANPISQVWGGLSVGVPGELRGVAHIHSHYGVLTWEHVVRPAVDIARNGWTVDEDLLYYMDSTLERKAGDFFVEDPSWAEDFAPNGRKVKVGDVMTRKRYADTLELIGRKGVDVFYHGPMAEASVMAARAKGGVMTVADLGNYEAEIRKPVQAEYDGFLITSCPAPAGGASVLSIMKMMEGYEGIEEPGMVNLTTHRLNEAMRFAYGARALMGDPRYVANMDAFEAEITSEEYARTVREKISDDRTQDMGTYDPGEWAVPEAVRLFPRCSS